MKTTTTLKALILIILPLSLQTVFSQVRIVEKIDIYPQVEQLKKGAYSLDSARYKAPYSGSYLGSVSLSARDVAPLIGPLTVTVKDPLRDTTIIFDLNDYIVQTTVWPCSLLLHLPCVNPPQYPAFNFYEAYSAYWQSDTESIHKCFRIPYVLKNDTLKFAYYNWTDDPNEDMGYDVEMAINDPLYGCSSYPDGTQELKLCGIDLAPMRFTIYKEEDTLIMGSSAVLGINPFDRFRGACSKIDDSLMTLELDSTQYAQFIYDKGTSIDTLTSPVDSIKVSDAMTGKVKFYAAGNKPDKPTPVRICARLMSDSSRVFEDTIVVKGSEILLGETKYYYVTEKDGKLKIHETFLPELPSGSDVIRTDIWGDSPVGRDTSKPNYGRQTGVYWEKEKPIPSDTTHNLPVGMIRLIGRYWHKDSIYTVRLAAEYNSSKTHLEIDIKKPGRLGDSHNDPERNVFGNQIVINDTIIKTSGVYGIPPQIIKGQIFKESDPKFSPCYRYEPWEDLKFQKNNFTRYFGNGKYFVVTKTTMGSGPAIPSTHSYFPGKEYERSPITIRNYLADNPYQYIKRANLEFMNDSTITRKWQEIFRLTKVSYPNLTKEQLQNISLEMTMDSLRNKALGRSDYDTIAQTRIMASYGYLQCTHYSATDIGLYGFTKTSTTQPPEYLNDEVYNFPAYGERMYKNKDAKNKVWANLSTSNWPNGYENVWLRALDWYNHGEANYEKDVLNYAKNYLPVKGE